MKLEQSIPEDMQDAFYDSLEEMDFKRKRDKRSKEQQKRATDMLRPYIPKRKGQRNKELSAKRTRTQRQTDRAEKERREELDARERRLNADRLERDKRRGF